VTTDLLVAFARSASAVLPLVGQLELLRLLERQRPVADFLAPGVLFRVALSGLRVRLGPEVLPGTRSAAELERDQVVFLVVARVAVGVAPGCQLGSLERARVARRRADRRRPALTQTVFPIVAWVTL
jgi:hypothetical protein